MALESLGKSLRNTLKKIARSTTVDAELIKEVVRDIQRALLKADVNVQLSLDLSKRVEKRALEEKPPAGMSPREYVVRIIYEELVGVLGESYEVPLSTKRIMLVGLYGQGKTTSAGKMARWFQKKGLSVGLVQADVHRPAAFEQLTQFVEEIHIPVFGDSKAKKAPKIAREGLLEFKDRSLVIVDTSGRHSLEKDLIKEIKLVANVVKPDEILLVIDASVGQQAGPQAKAFHDAVGVTGVIITKLDGSAKGGGALSAVSETQAPVVFIGSGEHIGDIERFDPPRFISRLLGMGDIETLLEKASEAMDEEKAEETARKIMSGKFTLVEMYEQMEALTNMGPLSKIFSMLPGVGGAQLSDEEMEKTQRLLASFRVIMDSMTKEEMENPKLVKSQRIKRISRGAGVEPSDVKELLKRYNASKRAMKGMMGNRKMQRAMRKQMKSGQFDFPGMGGG
ncbi:MAG: signal recognition particle protein [Thermoplasmata archaeon]|nr:signal recognition particle protein [Thermoplasmata archaeon]